MFSSPATSSHFQPFSTKLQSPFSPSYLRLRLRLHLAKNPNRKAHSTNHQYASISCCSSSLPNPSNTTTTLFLPLPTTPTTNPIAVVKKRKRYRKQYPGESKGIVEEMRFVAMRIRPKEKKGKKVGREKEEEEQEATPPSDDMCQDSWEPSIEGFLKFLVDSKLVFETLDRIVDQSDHVTYAYFRKTGLERSEAIRKDLDWFREQGIAIPEPGPPGISYAKYLEEIAEKSAPSFLCHFYNIYFAHIAGGQVIAKQVSEKIPYGKELEFCKWDGDVPELLKDMRENLNNVGGHWSRDEKNRCLREAAKSFKFSGQILRSIIL